MFFLVGVVLSNQGFYKSGNGQGKKFKIIE